MTETTPRSASATWSQRHGTTPRTLGESAPPGMVPNVLWWNPAWFAVGAAIALAVLGLMSIYLTDDPAHPRVYRQAVYLAVGIVACLALAIVRPRWWREFSYPLAVITILLLIFLLIEFVPDWIVRPYNGARRWINLHYIDFQPSELAKIAFVMALANYLRYRKNYRTLVGLIVPFAIMLLPMVLILIEPDLGMAMLLPPVLFAMLLAAGAKIKHIMAIIGLGLATGFMIATISLSAADQDPPQYPLLEKHQVDRIQGLVDLIKGDERHRDTSTYQPFKAMTIVGAGGFRGLGWERSRNVIRFNRLPENYNDMIYAVVVNRWGFLGGTIMIGIYLVYLLSLVAVAAVSRNPYGRLVCVGFAAIVAAQMVVNVGMTIGILPITGMSLPFVSYGGSSLVSNFMMTGIVLGIALRPGKFFERPSFEFDHESVKKPDPLNHLRINPR